MHFGNLKVDDGVKLYQQYIVKIPFVDDQAGVPVGPQGGRRRGRASTRHRPPAPGSVRDTAGSQVRTRCPPSPAGTSRHRCPAGTRRPLPDRPGRASHTGRVRLAILTP